ncbi:MAG: metalloregulator ArsR/SmtB family transcription factor [Xanthomonadales bacterium]|nr:metalloregulator ArsR/SmtB family transcription factor [Xanthomonadales bacterium]
MELEHGSALLRTLADATRLRLLALLRAEELSVAELSAVTSLAQPRVSTHLARLKDAGLVQDRRQGVSAYYRAAGEAEAGASTLFEALAGQLDDALLDQDAARLRAVLAERRGGAWADSVAGSMERHYSPGRTWETLTHAFTTLLEPGDVLDVGSGDGVIAELLAPRARSLTCLDISERVVAAARERLAGVPRVRVEVGDMHALPESDASYDLVLLLNALTYSATPARAIAEAARALRPGGRLLATTLCRHAHAAAAKPFGHVNLGFRREDLRRHCQAAGLTVLSLERSGRERRPPHFEILTLLAARP